MRKKKREISEAGILLGLQIFFETFRSFPFSTLANEIPSSDRSYYIVARIAKKEDQENLLVSVQESRAQNPELRIRSIFHPDVDAAKASLENMPANVYESVCVPDLGDFLGYQGAGHQVSTPEHKSPATPASSTTSNSSSTTNPRTGTQPSAPLQPPSATATATATATLPSRPYHNDGKCLFFTIKSYRKYSMRREAGLFICPIATTNESGCHSAEEFLIVTSGLLIASLGSPRLHVLPQVSHYRRCSSLI